MRRLVLALLVAVPVVAASHASVGLDDFTEEEVSRARDVAHPDGAVLRLAQLDNAVHRAIRTGEAAHSVTDATNRSQGALDTLRRVNATIDRKIRSPDSVDPATYLALHYHAEQAVTTFRRSLGGDLSRSERRRVKAIRRDPAVRPVRGKQRALRDAEFDPSQSSFDGLARATSRLGAELDGESPADRVRDHIVSRQRAIQEQADVPSASPDRTGGGRRGSLEGRRGTVTR